MKNLTAIKHSRENKITLYQNNKFKCKLTRRALETLLKNHILYIDEAWRTITQGQQYFKIAEKFK